jgi:hypothetical protein
MMERGRKNRSLDSHKQHQVIVFLEAVSLFQIRTVVIDMEKAQVPIYLQEVGSRILFAHWELV